MEGIACLCMGSDRQELSSCPWQYIALPPQRHQGPWQTSRCDFGVHPLTFTSWRTICQFEKFHHSGMTESVHKERNKIYFLKVLSFSLKIKKLGFGRCKTNANFGHSFFKEKNKISIKLGINIINFNFIKIPLITKLFIVGFENSFVQEAIPPPMSSLHQVI